ncbi:MAG: adenylosuccinate synthase [Acidobacteriota bacterium]
MRNVIVLGLQWGDEGKGKIVDLLCPAFDVVVRYQGGHNAGHTVKFGDRTFALHLIPSGILHAGTQCVLGNGMVIAPDALFDELDRLRTNGIEVDGRLWIADRAQVILPAHAALDQAREAARGARKIGTTARGIGPAYELRAARCGVRIADLASDDLAERLREQDHRLRAELANLGAPPPPAIDDVVATCRDWHARLAPYVCDTVDRLHDWLGDGRRVMFEGAQGALLDNEHGTYPFVTSSSTIAGGACVGAGVPPRAIDGVLGVIKAYTTRVGGGPFPTELDDAVGQTLRDRGHEYGTATGRPRRCGWFDAVAARRACRLSGVDALAITKLDVLDTLDVLRICDGYEHPDGTDAAWPADVATLERVRPRYREFPGWQSDTVGVTDVDALPVNARRYLDALTEATGVPVGIVSTGPRREETALVSGDPLGAMLGDRHPRVVAHRDGVRPDDPRA